MWICSASLLGFLALTLPSIAVAHIPGYCDPFIDRFVEASAGVSDRLDEYGLWLKRRKDRVHDLTSEEAADLVRMIRDRDAAQMEEARATIKLLECIGQ